MFLFPGKQGKKKRVCSEKQMFSFRDDSISQGLGLQKVARANYYKNDWKSK